MADGKAGEVHEIEQLRLGMIMGAGPKLKRGLTAVPPKTLRDGSTDDLGAFSGQVVAVLEADLDTVLSHKLQEPTRQALVSFVGLLLRAAENDALATRTMARLYSAGVRSDPAFTDPKVREHPDALSGMGLEQWLPDWSRRVHNEEADALDQFAFVHAVLEGRVRPLLLALPVLADIAAGAIQAELGQEGLRHLHEGIQAAYYRSGQDDHYVDYDGKLLGRKVWKLKDFESARSELRALTDDTPLEPREKAGLQALRKHLHQNSLHPELRDDRSPGGVNYNEIRHAVAHLNLSLTDGQVHLGRGLVMAEWLGGKSNVPLQAFNAEARLEVVEEAWDLFALSWACELAANLVDWWLSCTLLKDVPYPSGNGPHAAQKVDGYRGRATTMLAAIAASAGGLD